LYEWVVNGVEVADAQRIHSDLLSLDVPSWSQLTASFPNVITLRVARTLIDRAHALLTVAPEAAVAIAHSATLVVAHAPASADAELITSIEVDGDAWKTYAQALLCIGRYPEAEAAANNASTMYTLGQLDEKQATLGLIAGEILHNLGQTDKGLITIEQNTNLLLSFFENKKRYVQGRLIYAKVLVDARRPKEALEVFLNTAGLAEELEDKELQAYVLHNAGICYNLLGKFNKACACTEIALEIFEELGQKTNAIRSRFELATLLVARGKFKQAINEFYMNQNALLALGLIVEAAHVGLTIVETLPLDGRDADVPPLCKWMIDTFNKAGMHRKALEALGHLNLVAQKKGSLTADDVQSVRSVLDLLGSAHADQDIQHV
jgi:tetratricopeptide (TPR) repeat protein